MVPDATGYDGVIRGGLDPEDARMAAAISVQQMVMANPKDHTLLGNSMDANHDGRVSVDEALHSGLIDAVIDPDIKIAGSPFVSIGFGIHLIPCDSGSCAATTIEDRCHDRVLDGNETDIDCGGSCGACGFDAACVVASDCQSGACDAGACVAPTCDDGIQNGFEGGVDCDSAACAGKCPGEACLANDDCHSHVCKATKCE